MHEPHVHSAGEGVTPAMLRLTDVAVARFRKVMAEERLGAEHGVRISVNSGGCSGMSYSMGFDTEARTGDTVLVQDGLKLFIDGQSLPYLEGVTVDYVVGLHKEGFKFINPKATRTCGCGESFGV